MSIHVQIYLGISATETKRAGHEDDIMGIMVVQMKKIKRQRVGELTVTPVIQLINRNISKKIRTAEAGT